MELLSPAGGEEQLDYAILFGADAVYLAVDRFGMRSRAVNFTMDELPRIVAKAHAANVKVHLTCNTMMSDSDFAELPLFFEQAANAGVDALIIGDLGAAVLSRKYAPSTELHASTQGSICNSESAKVWHSLGASRVVAARELSLTDMARLKQGMPEGMELEAFAHGAMCMGYSGRCLVSDFLNGRSGIYGNCAQSCRWQYTLVQETEPNRFSPMDDNRPTYFLNAEDLRMLDHIDDLRDAGVDSLKIEGRTKKAYYVACVTNAYRQVIDGAPASQFMNELESVSHRPYSTGFYYGLAHQTEELVYVRNTSWAAQVLECQKADSSSWRIKLKCRTKFSSSDHLELVSPHQPVRNIALQQLLYDPTSRTHVLNEKASPDWAPVSETPIPVEIADHPAENYYAIADSPMHPNDIIRVVK